MDSTDGPEEEEKQEPGMPPSPYVWQKQLPVAMHQVDRVVFSVVISSASSCQAHKVCVLRFLVQSN